MVWFEVFIPAKEPGLPNVTLTVEAQNWIGALRTGLSNLGEGHEAIANVMCDIKEDNSIHVTDVSTHRVFRLREVQQPKPAPASTSLAPENTLKQPAAPPQNDPPTPPDGVVAPAFGGPSLGAARPVSMPDVGAISAPVGLSPPEDSGATIPNPVSPGPALAPPAFTAPLPSPEHSVPWTRMKGPHEAADDAAAATLELAADVPLLVPPPRAAPPPAAVWPPTPVIPADLAPTVPSAPPPSPPSPPPASASAPVTAAVPGFQAPPPTVNELPKKKKGREPVEPTERIVRGPAPGPEVKTNPRGPSLAEKKTGPVPAPTPRGSPAPPPKRSSGQFDAAPLPARREESLPSPTQPSPIGRAKPSTTPQAVADAVADVFDATQELLMEESIAPAAIAERLLDIALLHVPAESGSFYLADVNGHELHFAAVRGPKAKEIQQKKLSVKVGQGIVGFCALEGVCLSVSDIQKDPRYFSAVAAAVGHSPRDTLCASAEKDGRLFGAVQLINSVDGFSPVHMEVLRYIGLTAASLLERHFDNL